MFTPVEPAPATAPTTGLVRSAITPNDGVRWQDGLAWRSEYCPTARGFDPCAVGADVFEDPAVGGGGDDLVYYRPVAFRVEDRCGTRTGRQARDPGRVRRQAIAVTSFMVARELERGDLSQANPYQLPGSVEDTRNAYLASPDGEVVPGTWEPAAGLGALEEAVRDHTLGMDPFLHVPVRLISTLGDHLVREGALLYTRTGARVVADAGYSGAGPEVASTAEVQTITITGAPTGGTWTATWSGDTTDPIAYNAAAGTVQTALRALSVDGAEDITVTGSAGGPYTVTFPAAQGNVPQMTASGAGLTGGSSPAVNVATTTPGTNESATAGLWLYATGPVQVRLDDVVTSSLVDHRANEVVNTAERLFAATFDPCTLFQVQITDPAPAP